MTKPYSNAAAASYWGIERLAGIDVGDERSEDLAVLCYGKREEISVAYGSWELKVIDTILDQKPLGVVLDLGCGVGRTLRHIGPRATKLIGVDISPEMIERANLRLSEHADVELLIAGLDEVPAECSDVDLAICFGVFEHVPQFVRQKSTNQIAKALRCGGQLLLELNNASVLLTQNDRDNPFRIGCQLDNGYYCELIDTDATLAAVRAAGMSLVRCFRNPFYSVLRHLAPNDPHLAEAMELAVGLDVRCDSSLAGLVCDQTIFQFIKD